MAINNSSRREITAELSAKALKRLRRDFNLVSSEVWVDETHRVDFVAYRSRIREAIKECRERGRHER